ncbi:hypothetical protein [Flammeovirga aprica]|uniref:Uncharacterized protein n=1 Tax=Flammeovirga aprica JL-4 TaxID=694437 RepID=A0A7X9RXP7_9BACT|nr:hypothetical protein [Flammeovirga aprica]NME70579.1 hypothetical protein [Flammeovirga aprica JL-4]
MKKIILFISTIISLSIISNAQEVYKDWVVKPTPPGGVYVITTENWNFNSEETVACKLSYIRSQGDFVAVSFEAKYWNPIKEEWNNVLWKDPKGKPSVFLDDTGLYFSPLDDRKALVMYDIDKGQRIEKVIGKLSSEDKVTLYFNVDGEVIAIDQSCKGFIAAYLKMTEKSILAK